MLNETDNFVEVHEASYTSCLDRWGDTHWDLHKLVNINIYIYIEMPSINTLENCEIV